MIHSNLVLVVTLLKKKDGLSKRVKEQINWANLIVGWIRFFGIILIQNIKGNEKARAEEDKTLEGYYEKHNRYPLGNRDRKKPESTLL